MTGSVFGLGKIVILMNLGGTGSVPLEELKGSECTGKRVMQKVKSPISRGEVVGR